MTCKDCLVVATGMIIHYPHNSTAPDYVYTGLMCGVCKNPTTEDFECDKTKFEINNKLKKIIEQEVKE